MTKYALFNEDGTITGYGSVNKSNRKAVETTESELSSIFEDAGIDTLPGTDIPIDDAVQNPLSFTDYLVLDDGDIVFDDSYERDLEDE